MNIDILKRTKFYHQSGSRFFANLRDTRNVICSISHQCLKINKLLGIYLILFLHILRIVIFNLRFSALGLRYSDFNPVSSNLQKIPVSRHQRDIHPHLFRTLCQSSQYIVCFQSRLLHDLNTHGV